MHHAACSILKAERLKADLLKAHIAKCVIAHNNARCHLHTHQLFLGEEGLLLGEASENFQLLRNVVYLDQSFGEEAMQRFVVELLILQVGYQFLKWHKHWEVGLKKRESQGSLIG